MIKKSGESEHTCPVPDLKENICSISLLSVLLAVGLSYVTFIMLSYVPSIPTGCVGSGASWEGL